jgi:hypothetical protein
VTLNPTKGTQWVERARTAEEASPTGKYIVANGSTGFSKWGVPAVRGTVFREDEIDGASSEIIAHLRRQGVIRPAFAEEVEAFDKMFPISDAEESAHQREIEKLARSLNDRTAEAKTPAVRAAFCLELLREIGVFEGNIRMILMNHDGADASPSGMLRFHVPRGRKVKRLAACHDLMKQAIRELTQRLAIDTEGLDDAQFSSMPLHDLAAQLDQVYQNAPNPVFHPTEQFLKRLHSKFLSREQRQPQASVVVVETPPKPRGLLRSLVVDFEAAAKQFPEVIHMTVGRELLMKLPAAAPDGRMSFQMKVLFGDRADASVSPKDDSVWILRGSFDGQAAFRRLSELARAYVDDGKDWMETIYATVDSLGIVKPNAFNGVSLTVDVFTASLHTINALAPTAERSAADITASVSDAFVEAVRELRPLSPLTDVRTLLGVELRHKMAMLEPLRRRGWKADLCECHIAIRRALDHAWWITECGLMDFREHAVNPNAILPYLDKLAGTRGYGGVRTGGLVASAESALTQASLGELQRAYGSLPESPGKGIVGHFAACCAHEAALHFARGVRSHYENAIHFESDPVKQAEAFCQLMIKEQAVDHAALVALMEMETAGASSHGIPISVHAPHPPDGPQPPNTFWWGGKSTEVPLTSFKILEFLWRHESRTAQVEAVKDEVWGVNKEVSDDAIDSAKRKANSALERVKYPGSISQKSGYMILS